jgi:hypothetical protein
MGNQSTVISPNVKWTLLKWKIFLENLFCSFYAKRKTIWFGKQIRDFSVEWVFHRIFLKNYYFLFGLPLEFSIIFRIRYFLKFLKWFFFNFINFFEKISQSLAKLKPIFFFNKKLSLHPTLTKKEKKSVKRYQMKYLIHFFNC